MFVPTCVLFKVNSAEPQIADNDLSQIILDSSISVVYIVEFIDPAAGSVQSGSKTFVPSFFFLVAVEGILHGFTCHVNVPTSVVL